jgi:tripartite-type tricarboxylate transporter receptor subunit TctC
VVQPDAARRRALLLAKRWRKKRRILQGIRSVLLYTMHRRTFLLTTLASAASRGFAQTLPLRWPTRPVRIVVGFPGGSSPDLLARTLADPLAQALSQPVIVDNKAGAAGNIAAEAVAHASDGHTLGLMINGNMTVAKLLNPRLGYDPVRDLLPVSLIGTAPLVLAAPAHAPGASPREFIAAARAAGDKWSYGSPGVGTVAHLGMELVNARAGLQAVHVPYAGNPQVITAMQTGDIQLALLPPGLVAPHVKAGRLRAIALTSAARSTLAPEVPSIAEAGLPDVNLEIWDAIAAPRSMPQPVAARLADLFGDIVRRPEVRERLFQQGWQVAGTGPEGLARRIEADVALLGGVATARGIKAE